MILVLSSPNDYSTDKVIDWLDLCEAKYVRVQPKELLRSNGGVQIPLNELSRTIEIRGKKIRPTDINVVWHRKWHYWNDIDGELVFDDSRNKLELQRILANEYKVLSDYIFGLFSHAIWLDHFIPARISKLEQLRHAAEVGLNIPTTIVTAYKTDVKIFLDDHQNVITKPIENGLLLKFDRLYFQSYTSSFTNDDLANLPETFFPSLFQEKIEKEIEIRIFYLDGVCYSMAVFSQMDERAKIDSRKYNNLKPIRNVAFNLPSDIELKITELMKSLGLKTGSIDIIKTSNGKYYFLEVNPAGQYEMTSKPCNYNLDKLIAEYLIRNDNHKS